MSVELFSSWCRGASGVPQRRRPCPPVSVLAPAKTPEQAQDNNAAVKAARLITAIKTPYLPSGKFDLTAYDQLVDIQASHGVEGLIVGGTTGEGQLMSWDEHIMLIAHTVNTFGSRLLVVGNTGSNSTREAVHATEQGFAVGMHAALQINPYYGKTSAAGLAHHFQAVLAEGPGIVYNVPGRTGQDIPDEVIHSLASSPGFLGVKECTGNPRIQNYTGKGVTCWSGNDDEAHEARHSADAQGVISVTSNLVPGLFAELMRGPQPELALKAEALIAWLFQEPNPIGINTALAMCGLVQPVFRLPYVPLGRVQREKGVQLLEDLREWLPGVESIQALEDADFTLLASF